VSDPEAHHVVIRRFQEPYMVWEPGCSCGWKGDRQDEVSAKADAYDHEFPDNRLPSKEQKASMFSREHPGNSRIL